MLNFMHTRAEALIWDIESGARFLGHDKNSLPRLIEEMARQPGIAWIALVTRDGYIILDSNPELAGKYLYTRKEMEGMAPDHSAQGRFSPDEPQIYETWKLFNPGRLKGHKSRNIWNFRDAPVIFVAQDATFFQRGLKNYEYHLWLISSLVLLALAAFIILLFYAYNLNLSRRQLADARALSTQVLASFPSPLLAADTSLNIIFANALARNFFAIKDAQKTENLKKLFFFDWDAIVKELDLDKNILERECEINSPASGQVPVRLTAARIKDAIGKPAGYLFIFRNLAEISMLKKKLRQSERLSSLGKLASGLAHEIRNPLSSICGYARYLEEKLHGEPLAAGAATLLVEEANRVNNVLSDLLSVARQPELHLQKASLKDILERTYQLALPDAKARGVEMTIELPAGKEKNYLAMVDRDRLIQAFLNLALNALQAAPDGGRVSMVLEYSPRPASESEKIFSSAQGPAWLVKFRDNGPGMTDEIKKQIFTPYFTTKDSGSGLGLSITREIVESHDGAIIVRGNPGEGAEFIVILPAGEPDEK